ncbi:hypothetical protein GECvBMG_gp203 [Salmonella phage GEC_vB_MG]|nr:hypothetical protein GECvBMG_gp203 [Salmonella phage GEC_vB_MG]
MLKKDSSHNGLDEKSYQMRVILTVFIRND